MSLMIVFSGEAMYIEEDRWRFSIKWIYFSFQIPFLGALVQFAFESLVMKLLMININIYTPSVFCYDKQMKNFDIQFSMKRHETV